MPDCDKTNKSNVSMDTERNKKMNKVSSVFQRKVVHAAWPIE